MPYSPTHWRPTSVTRYVEGFRTALFTTRVDTDCGEGFIKTLGTPEGPHPLACELIGSLAADWIGLPTFDFSLISMGQTDAVPFENGSSSSPGSAFITRAENDGFTWGGDAQTLTSVREHEMCSRLMVLDTWIRNCDRHAPDGGRINRKNVFLKQRLEPRRLELVAMDFTHAFTCGHLLDRRISHIDRIKDEKVYGLFPEFKQYVTIDLVSQCCGKLATFDTATAQLFVNLIPDDWQVDAQVKGHLRRFLVERAHFLADHLVRIMWPQSENLFGGNLNA